MEKLEVFLHKLDGDRIDKQAAIKEAGPKESLVVYFSLADGSENGHEFVSNNELHDPLKWRIYFDEQTWHNYMTSQFHRDGIARFDNIEALDSMKTLTTHEASEYTGRSIRTLYRHCRPIYSGRAGEPSLWAIKDLKALVARYNGKLSRSYN